MKKLSLVLLLLSSFTLLPSPAIANAQIHQEYTVSRPALVIMSGTVKVTSDASDIFYSPEIPKTADYILGTANKGEHFSVEGKQGRFYLIDYQGTSGYILASTVSYSEILE